MAQKFGSFQGTNNVMYLNHSGSVSTGDIWFDHGNSAIKIYNGTSWDEVGSGSGGGGVSYSVSTSNVTATANQGIIADTSGGSFTVTLPASPSTGDKVFIADGADFATNNLTVARNGSTIEGTSEDFILDVGGPNVGFIYDGTTWQVYPQSGLMSIRGIEDNSTSTAITINSSQDVSFSGNVTLGYVDGDFYVTDSSTTNGYVQIGEKYIYGLDNVGGGSFNIQSNGASYFTGGNLGIGTTSPSHNLDVTSSTASTDVSMRVGPTSSTGDNDGTLIINNGGSGDAMLRFDYEGNTDRARIGVTTSGQQLEFYTAGANERMRIDSSGNVGIGETSAQAKLHVTSASSGLQQWERSANKIKFEMSTIASGGYGFYDTVAAQYDAYFKNGNVGIGTTSPSAYSNYKTLTLQDTTGGEIDFKNGSGQVVGAIYNTANTLTIAGDFSSAIASSAISFTIDGSERLRLANDSSLDLAGDFYVGSSNNIIYESGTTFNVRAAVANLTFQTNGANERMRIDSSGDVLIGTSATSYLNAANRQVCHVNGGTDGAILALTGTASGSYPGSTGDFYIASGASGSANTSLVTRSNGYMNFYTNNTERMRLETDGDLHVDGDVIAYSTTISDQRLKDNVETIDKALDKVTSLRGVTYTWNTGSREGKSDLGVIAQEVEAIIPEIVHDKEMALVDGETYKTVDYEKLTALLIEAIKELKAEVDELKASK